MPAGRPTKYVPETIDKLLTAIKLGAPYTHACNYAGISFETFSQWQKKYPELVERLKEAEGAAVVQWLAKIEKAASEGSWQAMAWKLERRYPESFGRRDRTPIDVSELDSSIDVELKRMAELASRSEAKTSGEAEGETVH